MEIEVIEHLAAKYLEVGGNGSLDSHRVFVRRADVENVEAHTLWSDRVEVLSDDDRRRFELLVEDLRIATN